MSAAAAQPHRAWGHVKTLGGAGRLYMRVHVCAFISEGEIANQLQSHGQQGHDEAEGSLIKDV